MRRQVAHRTQSGRARRHLCASGATPLHARGRAARERRRRGAHRIRVRREQHRVPPAARDQARRAAAPHPPWLTIRREQIWVNVCVSLLASRPRASDPSCPARRSTSSVSPTCSAYTPSEGASPLAASLASSGLSFSFSASFPLYVLHLCLTLSYLHS